MPLSDGSLARTLDFGETAPAAWTDAGGSRGAIARRGRPSNRPRAIPAASPRRLALLRGPDKYRLLDTRRRAAQIRARHAMDLIDMIEQSSGRSE